MYDFSKIDYKNSKSVIFGKGFFPKCGFCGQRGNVKYIHNEIYIDAGYGVLFHTECLNEVLTHENKYMWDTVAQANNLIKMWCIEGDIYRSGKFPDVFIESYKIDYIKCWSYKALRLSFQYKQWSEAVARGEIENI